MTTRGVSKPGVRMVTSRMLGVFRENSETRNEFLRLIGRPNPWQPVFCRSGRRSSSPATTLESWKRFASCLMASANRSSAVELGLESPAETQTSFAGNALLKAQTASRETGLVALADDSGLCVDVLKDEPGIYTARWAREAGGGPRPTAR